METIVGCGFEPLVCADTYHDGFDFYLAEEKVVTPELCEYVRLNPDCGRIWPCLVTDPPPETFAAFSMGTKSQMLRLRDALNRALPGKLSMHVLRSPKYTGFMCEVAPGGVTKWSAVRRLAHDWGVSDAEICAVGDDVNDVPMIRGAGLGVAMGNALPEVKEAADRVAPSHDADGLVHVVEWLLRDSTTPDDRSIASQPKPGFQGV